MGGKSKPAPAAPDYTKLANEQARLQNEMIDKTTAANRVNQTNPLGSITWQQDPATGQWVQNETWSPEITKAFQDSLGWTEKLREFETGRMGNETSRMADQLDYDRARAQYEKDRMGRSSQFESDMMDFERQRMGWAGDQMDMMRGFMDRINSMASQSAPSAPGLPSYDGGYGGDYAKAFTESALSRVLPQQAREQEALTNKLRLQGLQPGTEAFNRAYTNMLTAHGDVQAKASIDGGLAGAQEARERYLALLQGQNQAFDQSMKSYLMPWQVAQMQMGMMGNAMSGLPGGDIGNGLITGVGSNIYGGAGGGVSSDAQNLGGTPTPSFRDYSQSGDYKAPEILNAAQQTYAQQMQQYNEAQKSKAGKGGSIGSLAGAIGGSFFGMPTLGASLGGGLGSMFSDLRLKSDVSQMSDAECYEQVKKIVPIKWRWNGTSVEDSGISAQQILDELPHLTNRAERGMLQVNYTALFAMLLGAFRHLASLNEEPKENIDAAV